MKKSCMAASQDKLFEKAEYKQDLRKEIAYFEEADRDIYFMPVDGGCVVITKDFALDANKLVEAAPADQPAKK